MINDPCDDWSAVYQMPRPPMIIVIQNTVADLFQIARSDMQSASRCRDVARPRQVAIYLAKQMTPRSLSEIGRRFGGRDHTTVLYAIKQIDRLRRIDGDLDARLRSARRLIELAA